MRHTTPCSTPNVTGQRNHHLPYLPAVQARTDTGVCNYTRIHQKAWLLCPSVDGWMKHPLSNENTCEEGA